jgi:hypothetical protein
MTRGASQALAAAVASSAEGDANWRFGQLAEIEATAASAGPDRATS